MDRNFYIDSIIQMLSLCSNEKIRCVYSLVLHLCR